MAFVMYRAGNFAYVMSPLIFLFAGRNNRILWLTNWSHSTYLLSYRWIARVFAVQVLLHSILAVVLYKKEGTYDAQVSAPYWIWGIVATLSVVVLTFGSSLYDRMFAYEFFLITHIVFSVVLIIGCWYHAYDLYQFLGGYEDWIYAMSAVWVFDRLGRIVRIAMIGPHRAKATELGEEHVRIDVPGVRWGIEPGKHVYVYFPSLNLWRPWESRPFSVLPTDLLQSSYHLKSDSENNSQSLVECSEALAPYDAEKNVNSPTVSGGGAHHNRSAVGLTLYVKKAKGITKSLCPSNSLLTLVEGPYSNSSTREVLRCDRLLLISGGIGITGVLPFLRNHWKVKLAWSINESAKCLFDDLNGVIGNVADREIRIGNRLNIEQIADEVEADWAKVGVVVAGPGGLCDQVRACVTRAEKLGKTQFELDVEAYSW
ncbi:hypothetical protein TRVA0_047S00298 [Trichomonascus vanleenenianus]|uniref:ferric reductase family protein n=1 Tax=Trichomonascus vanleenenianus TaxID=2268995 RepID=UPI003ECAC1E5